jgi:hypothetical protein
VARSEIRSLEPILEELKTEREFQLRHFDALDAKAGIILGFAGALVALSPSGGPLIDVGRYAAVASGLLSLWAFWPRRFWSMSLRPLRDLYLASEPAFTRLRILDTQIEMTEQLSRTLHEKARRLKLGMVTLAGAILLMSVGLGLQ